MIEVAEAFGAVALCVLALAGILYAAGLFFNGITFFRRAVRSYRITRREHKRHPVI